MRNISVACRMPLSNRNDVLSASPQMILNLMQIEPIHRFEQFVKVEL